MPTSDVRPLTITYDAEQRTITLDVVVDWTGGTIMAPPLAVPSGTWTVIWNLVGESGDFNPLTGIFMHLGRPAEIKIRDSHHKPPARWHCTIDHQVDKVNYVGYTIRLDSIAAATAHGAKRSLSHDPTIAVTPDPMG
jgi:hypothetical protein